MKEPNGPRRLTYVITSLGQGGAQQQVAHLVGRMVDRGWDVDVVTLLGDGEGSRSVQLPRTVQVRSLEMRRGVPDLRAVHRLARHLRARAPDVVHSHMVHANLVARLARPFSRVPVLVCTAHNISEAGRWVDIAYRWTDRLCDLTTNVSPQAVRRYIEVRAAPARRIRYVPNGIDLSSIASAPAPIDRAPRVGLGVSTEGFLWLNAGRHEPAKRLGTLLRAFRASLDESPEQNLILAGDGPERVSLQALAATLGIEDRVHFIGYRTDIIDLMRRVDGFVMSSDWEGLPMVLLEAGACGLPTVATRVGGVPEAVEDGTTGVLVDPGDVHGLAAAMTSMVALAPSDRSRMGAAARARVAERFELENVVNTWIEIYGELLGGRGRVVPPERADTSTR